MSFMANNNYNSQYDYRKQNHNKNYNKNVIKKIKFYASLMAIMIGGLKLNYTFLPPDSPISIKHLLPERSPFSKYAKAERELQYLIGYALSDDGRVLDASNSILYNVPKEERVDKWHEYCQKLGLKEAEEIALREQYSQVFYEKTR